MTDRIRHEGSLGNPIRAAVDGEGDGDGEATRVAVTGVERADERTDATA